MVANILSHIPMGLREQIKRDFQSRLYHWLFDQLGGLRKLPILSLSISPVPLDARPLLETSQGPTTTHQLRFRSSLTGEPVFLGHLSLRWAYPPPLKDILAVSEVLGQL